jgi:FHA domain/DUF1707 SHOCT-like domain
MGASGPAAESPTQPDAQPAGGLRASDAERDEVVSRLREEFAAGRLSQDTFLHRMDAVLEARHQADLPPLLADLPAAPQPSPPRPAPVQSVLGRLRAAWPRRLRSGATLPAGAVSRRQAGVPVRRLTAGMPRSGAGARRPARLQFPRGAGNFFSIGRDADCDLMIADMTVSRVHARLERAPDGWLLTDLASTNGTRVNGWRVRGQVPVRAGDLVSFGTAEYSLSEADGT